MSEYRDLTFENKTIFLPDGAQVSGCSFIRCEVVYGDGGLYVANHFDACYIRNREPWEPQSERIIAR